jgi:predicted PurR-regulated permease PerM
MNNTFRFRARFAWYLLAAAVAGVLPYLVAPILSAFLFAAILACICLPLVGFFGVLLASPASAALLVGMRVGMRHLRAQYPASDLYNY